MSSLDVFIDGCVEPVNPGGHGAWAWVAWRDYGVAAHTITASGYIGQGGRISNNVAEYYALMKFLKWFWKEGFDQATVHSDSAMLVKQMRGEFRVHAGFYRPYYEACRRLMARLGKQVRFIWIPREGNQRADSLCRQVLSGRAPII